MPIRTVQEVINLKPNFGLHYTGPAKYTVPGYEKPFQVAPWNHPSSLAKTILNWVQHTIFYGVYIVAPMGHGKTTIAQTLAHYLHLKDPRLKVVWAGGHEFTHQEKFFNSLPKRQPHVIIFDDISGALKQLSEKEIEHNFSTLTRVRDIIDPGVKRTPVISIVVGHYSKNLEKEFRAQLGMSIYASFGNEERTNLDSIAESGSDAYNTLKHFSDMYSDQYDNHKFTLYLANGKPLHFHTDKPFRCAAAISKTKGKIFLFTDKDVCEHCVKKKLRRVVPAQTYYSMIKGKYNLDGVQALQHLLYERGFTSALPKKLQKARNCLEQEIDPIYETNYNDLVEIIWREKHKAVPGKPNRSNKIRNEILEEFESKMTLIEDKKQEMIEPTLSLNEQFLA